MNRYQRRPEGWESTGYLTLNGDEVWSGNPIVERSYMHGRGTIVAEHDGHVDAVILKARCAGCSDEHYNRPGNSAGGECWAFKTAKVCDKIGHSTLNVENGPDTIMKETLSCWHAVSR